MERFLTTAAACVVTYAIISRIERLWNTYTRYKREQVAFERMIVVAETMVPWCKMFYQLITVEQSIRQTAIIRADVKEFGMRLLDLMHDKMRCAQYQSRVFEDVARQFPDIIRILFGQRPATTASTPNGLGSNPTASA